MPSSSIARDATGRGRENPGLSGPQRRAHDERMGWGLEMRLTLVLAFFAGMFLVFAIAGGN
jgi:hypothetical protein